MSKEKKICSVAECGKKAIAKGLCRSHYYKDRNARIKNGEWTPTPISGTKNVSPPVEIDDDEKYAVQVMENFRAQNHYYGRGAELLKFIDDKGVKPKLAKGIRTLDEKKLTKLSIVPSKKLLAAVLK